MKSFNTVSVIGLGYIGLPTAAAFAQHGANVIGVDVNQHAVETINQGKIHIVELDLDTAVQQCVTNGKLKASLTPEPADAFLIAVPTPFKFLALNGYSEELQGYGGEDVEFIHRATAFLSIRPYFKPNSSYFIDDRSYDVSSLIGFRNFYRTLYFKYFEEHYMYHFWHKRKNKSSYLKDRVENDRIMLKLMKSEEFLN